MGKVHSGREDSCQEEDNADVADGQKIVVSAIKLGKDTAVVGPHCDFLAQQK